MTTPSPDLRDLWEYNRSKHAEGYGGAGAPVHVGLYVPDVGLAAACFIRDYTMRGLQRNPDYPTDLSVAISWKFWIGRADVRALEAATNFAPNEWTSTGQLTFVEPGRLGSAVFAEVAGRAVNADIAGMTAIAPSPITESVAHNSIVPTLEAMYGDVNDADQSHDDLADVTRYAIHLIDDRERPRNESVELHDNPIMRWTLANEPVRIDAAGNLVPEQFGYHYHAGFMALVAAAWGLRDSRAAYAPVTVA